MAITDRKKQDMRLMELEREFHATIHGYEYQAHIPEGIENPVENAMTKDQEVAMDKIAQESFERLKREAVKNG